MDIADKTFLIDAETRVINIPDGEGNLGVEGDVGTGHKYFKCPRIVGDDGIDLNEHQIYISYVKTNTAKATKFVGDPALYHCNDVALDETGDYVTFSWEMSGDVFKTQGLIAFKVMAKKTDGESVKTCWNTRPAVGTVLMTLPDGIEGITELYPDIITQLLDRMDAVEEIATVEAMQGYVDDYLGRNPVQLDSTLTDPEKAAPADVVGGLNGDIAEITAKTEPVNYVVMSADNLYSKPDDLTIVYNSTTEVGITFPYDLGNPLIYFKLNGLSVGKSYILKFKILTGNIADADAQCVGHYEGSNFVSQQTGSVVDGYITISFSCVDTNTIFRIQCMRARSTSIVLTDFSCKEVGSTTKTFIKNEALINLSEDNLSDELKEKINVSSDIVKEVGESKNYIGSNFVSRKYIDGYTGTAMETGSAMSITDYVELNENTAYYWHGIKNGYWAFYSDKSESSFISGLPYMNANTDGYFITPRNTKYGRFSLDDANIGTAWISDVNKKPTGKLLYAINDSISESVKFPLNPCDYNGTEISIFTKCLCIGDSLTEGVCNYNEDGTEHANVSFPHYSYPTYLERITGCKTTNLGMAGKTTKEWYDVKGNYDFSGHDFCIIQLGVNDALYNKGWTTEESTALSNIVNAVKSQNKGIKIFVATIMKAISYGGTDFDNVSEGIRNFVKNINDENVILLDMAEYSHTGEEIAYNCGHLTAYGYFKLAEDYKAYISWYINQNKMQFRQVQFIGTTHSFN